MRKIGVHLSIAGGMYRAIELAKELKISSMQIFLKNTNQWHGKTYTDTDIRKFLEAKSGSPDLAIFAHAGYLINLAGIGDTYKKSIQALLDELHRAELLGIEYLVLHPGNHGNRGIDEGIERIADSLNLVFKHHPKTKILLENTAGQGTSIGHRFEELRSIIDRLSNQNMVGICLDTCHIFAAGYDISKKNSYESVISEFSDIIGINRLKLIHLNDSQRECGSRVDRHESIGEGLIGTAAFRRIVNDPRLKNIPMVLETPKSDDDTADRANLKKIRSLIR